MKLSAIYRSSKRANTYLYVAKRDGFEAVPKALMKQFGVPQLVTIVALDKHLKIAGIDKQKFVSRLTVQGYYLQLPPTEKNWLEEHRESLGLSGPVSQTQTRNQNSKSG